MTDVKAIVLRAAGINCDLETQHALELVGASARRIHVNRLIEDDALLDKFQIMVIPGGFSYGDDVAAGRILANQIIHHLSDALKKFVDDGKVILGICNGFQVLVKTGLLPGNNSRSEQNVTISYNDSGKFEDRWVYLSPQSDKCVLLEPNKQIYLPIAHGEGKVVTKTPEDFESLKAGGHIALKYVDKDGNEGGYPVNPNGSTESIAALTDSTGRVLGLMPHPERFTRKTQHPHWTRLPEDTPADGNTIFSNAVNFIKENF